MSPRGAWPPDFESTVCNCNYCNYIYMYSSLTQRGADHIYYISAVRCSLMTLMTWNSEDSRKFWAPENVYKVCMPPLTCGGRPLLCLSVLSSLGKHNLSRGL